MTTWQNWARTESATPVRVLTPRNAEEVAEAVTEAADRGLRVKMPGSGHSFTGIAVADGVLLDPAGLVGVTEVDRDAMTVTVLPGTPLHVLNASLDDLGLALHNMGDIDSQTVAGAVSTGTHGTGGVSASLSGQLQGLELVAADGTVHRVSRSRDPDLFQAARVGLGAMGVLTSLTFAVEPAFVLEAHERPMRWDELHASYDSLVEEHHHVDAYWYPHTDHCLVKTNDRSLDPAEPLGRLRGWFDDELLSNTLFGAVERACTRFPRITRQVNQVSGRALLARTYRDASHRVFISRRGVVFREMEYSLPRELGLEALAEIRRLIDRRGWQVPFPVEIRCTPPDEAWLSTSHGRWSMYLAFHLGARADHRPYFEGVEHVLHELSGQYAGDAAARPHWGKLHTRTAADLAPAYPRWDDFTAQRDRIDPARVFGNAYLDRVLG